MQIMFTPQDVVMAASLEGFKRGVVRFMEDEAISGCQSWIFTLSITRGSMPLCTHCWEAQVG